VKTAGFRSVNHYISEMIEDTHMAIVED